MVIKSEGFPDVLLGARKFRKPGAVISAIWLAREEDTPVDFVLTLKEMLDPELYLVESNLPDNRVTIKSLDESMEVGNEDEHLFEKLNR